MDPETSTSVEESSVTPNSWHGRAVKLSRDHCSGVHLHMGMGQNPGTLSEPQNSW